MTYAIINVVNGTYSIFAEGITSLASAKVTFHSRCTVLWNAPDVATAMVMIADENLMPLKDTRNSSITKFLPLWFPNPKNKRFFNGIMLPFVL